MKRLLAICLLIAPFAVPAAESAKAKGMTIFGDQEMPHVRTDLPWRNIDVDALEHESLAGIISGVLSESNRLSRQRIQAFAPVQNGRADFRELVQAYRLKPGKTGNE